MASFAEQQKKNLQNYINQTGSKDAAARLQAWNQTGNDPGMNYKAPAQPVQQQKSQTNPMQDAFKRYMDTVSSPFSQAESLAKNQASHLANQQRGALNSSLQSAATNRDVGLRGVESGLAEAKQRTDETNFQKYLASRQTMANKGLSGQGLAKDEDVRLQLAHNREITNVERDAANQRFALEQQYNDRSAALNHQLSQIDESALFNQFYQQYRGQEMQERAQQAQALQNYIGMLRQQEQDEYTKELDQRNFGYQQQRDQVGDQRYDQEWQNRLNQQKEDYLRYYNERDYGREQEAKKWDYQLQRDEVGDGRWEQEFNADQAYRNANLGLQRQQEARLAGNQSMDQLFDIWKLTGQAPSGIQGVEAGTPLYDEVGSRQANKPLNEKETYQALRNEFLQVAQAHRKTGQTPDMMSYIREEILPLRDEFIAEGMDINKVIDEVFYSFSGGQFPTKKAYYDFVKKQMNDNDAFNEWAKTQNLGFNDGKKGGGTALKSAPKQVASIFTSVGSKLGVDANLIAAISKAESGFRQNAKSSAGAIGLMQLMPGTAAGLKVNPHDPVQNVTGGARYIKDMMNRYNGDVQLALAAYNWGPGNVDKAIKKYGKSWTAISKYAPKETRNYVPKVLGYYS